MPQNKRVYFAVQSVHFSKLGESTFTVAHGVQSVGMNTTFNLEPIFEMGQLEVYELIENLPDTEMTVEKCLDGYPLLWHLATNGATSPSLAGRSNVRTTIGLAIFSDLQNSASGTPISRCTSSGMFPSTLNYTFPVQGSFSESVGFVGNNRFWNNNFAITSLNNDDEPLAIAGSGGVQRREDLILGQPTGDACILPANIPGVTSSGYVAYSTVNQEYSVALQNIQVSCNLGRDQLFELGKRGPYHRFVQFPVEVKTEIEFISLSGDFVQALEDVTNVTNQRIYIVAREGTKLDLGSKNKLATVSQSGGNAAQNGGNVTNSFSYTNFNSLSVYHPKDPSGF